MPIKQIHINLLLKSVFFFRKLSLVIFMFCFFHSLSAQIFIKNNTTFSVKESTIIHSSDSITLKQSIVTKKPKIYIIKGTPVHQLENADADITYISADKSPDKTQVAKISHKNPKTISHSKPAIERNTKQNFSGSPADKKLSNSGYNDVVMIFNNKPLSKFSIITESQKTYFKNSYLNSSCRLVNLKEKIDVSHHNYSVTRPPPVLM